MQYTAPNDGAILDLMTSVLETAWIAAGAQIGTLSQADRNAMAAAISEGVVGGELRFLFLYRKAIDTLNAPRIEAPRASVILEPPPPAIPVFALYPVRTMAACR